MVCYYFLSVVPLSKQKTVTQITAHFDPFTTTLQNGPIWFRFSAATVVFSCGSFEAGHVGGITCRSCPPRCYPHKYVSWLAPNMPGNLPGIASGRSNKENHGKKKKGTPRFSPMIPTLVVERGFLEGLPGKCENHHSSCRCPDHHHIIIILLLWQNFETFHHVFNTKLHVYGLHMVSGWGVEGEKHGWLWFKSCVCFKCFSCVCSCYTPRN